MKHKTRFFWILLPVLMLIGQAAFAASVGGMLLKTVAIGAVVNATAKPANDGLNKLVGLHHLPPGVDTKVVPILSVGEKSYVGMAQVAGARSLVEDVKAVLQVEVAFDNKQYRIKLLIPIDSVNPFGTKRVRGVGITGLLDTGVSRNSYEIPPSLGWRGGDVLKAAAIAYAATQFGPQINNFINSALQNEDATPKGVTKVVPYLSFGSKAYIGMMQVAGPEREIAKVKAVWQFEQLFDAGRVRLRALVPSDSTNPLKIRRVVGVGCTAVIDATMLRAKDERKHPEHYRYYRYAPIFVGPREDPHYRYPRGWDRDHKIEWNRYHRERSEWRHKQGWDQDHPPGWDRGRKAGWDKHGNPLLPPGQAKKLEPKHDRNKVIDLLTPRPGDHKESVTVLDNKRDGDKKPEQAKVKQQEQDKDKKKADAKDKKHGKNKKKNKDDKND